MVTNSSQGRQDGGVLGALLRLCKALLRLQLEYIVLYGAILRRLTQLS
jgi:hypothetical protein